MSTVGPGTWPGVDAELLIEQTVFPVCAPSLMGDGLPPLTSPSDLQHHTLLHSMARPDDWGHWLQAAGVAGAGNAAMAALMMPDP